MGSIEVYPAIMYPLWNIIKNVYRYLIKIIFHKWFIIAGCTGVGKHFNFFYNKLFRVTRTRCQVSRSRYVIYSQESYKLKLIDKTEEPKQIHRKQRFVVIIIPMYWKYNVNIWYAILLRRLSLSISSFVPNHVSVNIEK